jgi:ubiquinone/menaquinone biosynthesis C-methylase UbiE
MTRRLDRISRNWQRLGATDPLWAVYVAPGTQGGGWDIDKFLETGRAEVKRVLQSVAELGLPASHDTALDFGCGVGRLSQPLADQFARVISVDVSDAMLAQARELDRSSGRIEFVLNQSPDLSFVDDGSIDLVYTSLVLQHLPRSLAGVYLAEFVRVLTQDGVAVVQLATKPTASLKGWAFRLLPAAFIGWYQRRFLHYPAPMRMQAMPRTWAQRQIAAAGGTVVQMANDPTYGGHWVYTRYVIRRAATPGSTTARDR